MTSIPPLDDRLAAGARVLWVAAHPDDEVLSGGILARAGRHHGAATMIAVLTRGAGGEGPAGVGPEALAALRSLEMTNAAARYGATLRMAHCWNAPLPVSSFPTPAGVWERWRPEDPVGFVADAIREHAADIVLTFDPTHGFTGHPEHILTARVAAAAARAAGLDGAGCFGHILARGWVLRLARHADPGPVSEVFDARLPCGDTGLSCLDFSAEAALLHPSQISSMRPFRRLRGQFARVGLRWVDPADAVARWPLPE